VRVCIKEKKNKKKKKEKKKKQHGAPFGTRVIAFKVSASRMTLVGVDGCLKCAVAGSTGLQALLGSAFLKPTLVASCGALDRHTAPTDNPKRLSLVLPRSRSYHLVSFRGLDSGIALDTELLQGDAGEPSRAIVVHAPVLWHESLTVALCIWAPSNQKTRAELHISSLPAVVEVLAGYDRSAWIMVHCNLATHLA